MAFTKQLRDATRSVHDASDALVNLKLGVAMSDDGVWAEGLLVFHEIFAFLEAALARHSDSLLGDLAVAGLTNRTDAFQKDLDFYLGPHWRKGYRPRESVANYLRHLEMLEEENPYLLIAYVYHLYMGLLSGGQVLRGKRGVMNTLMMKGAEKAATEEAPAGEAVTHFGQHTIASLKRRMREATNRVAEALDEETRQAVIRESVKVFELNNDVIRSVRGVNQIFIKKFFVAFLALAGVVAVLVYLSYFLY